MAKKSIAKAMPKKEVVKASKPKKDNQEKAARDYLSHPKFSKFKGEK